MTTGVLVVGAAPAAVHAVADLRIPLDTVIVASVAEGDQVELALVASDALTGRSCTVRAIHDASGDVHPDNGLVVTSGVTSASLVDVERAPGATTDGTAPLTLGDVIRVELIMGPDESFGGDVDIELECDGVAPADDGAGVTALPVTGPSSTTVQFALGTLLLLAGYGLTVLARRPERS